LGGFKILDWSVTTMANMVNMAENSGCFRVGFGLVDQGSIQVDAGNSCPSGTGSTPVKIFVAKRCDRRRFMSGLKSTLIHELRHRLQTLEADLREASQAGRITEHDFQTRMQRMVRADQHAEKLLSVTSAQTLQTEIPSQVDLPVMSDASRLEQKIVSRFVKETKAYTKELAAKVGRATDWTIDAAHGVSGWFSAMWRLSWIKSQLRRVDQDIEAVRRARSVIEDFVAKSDISGRDPNPRKSQKDLLAAFQEFEAATGRVTSMRARLRGEVARNHDMRQWLEGYAKLRRQKAEGELPPEPEVLSEAFKSVSERLTGSAKVAHERLVIARQLITALEDPSEAKPRETIRPELRVAADHNPIPTSAPKGGGRAKRRQAERSTAASKGVPL
jgi:hypothetical protein